LTPLPCGIKLRDQWNPNNTSESSLINQNFTLQNQEDTIEML